MRTLGLKVGREFTDSLFRMAAANRGGKSTPFSHQEAIGGDRECGVMRKAAPAAAFEVAQSEFLSTTQKRQSPRLSQSGVWEILSGETVCWHTIAK
jgi:hypothetical protein